MDFYQIQSISHDIISMRYSWYSWENECESDLWFGNCFSRSFVGANPLMKTKRSHFLPAGVRYGFVYFALHLTFLCTKRLEYSFEFYEKWNFKSNKDMNTNRTSQTQIQIYKNNEWIKYKTTKCTSKIIKSHWYERGKEKWH